MDTSDLQIVLDFLMNATPIEEIPVCDAVFLFGSSKTDKIPKSGAELLKKARSSKIICTGKYSQRKEYFVQEGYDTEAEWYRGILHAEGISNQAIIIENKSTNTLENVLFGIEACHKHNLYPQSLILCPIPYLGRRSAATFKKQFPDIRTFNYKFDMPIDFYLPTFRLERIVGEFERFEKYGAKGDIAEVIVPKEVQDAVNQLKNQL